MVDITMPKLGETVTEGVITKCVRGLGEFVAEGEVVFEVSTDKVDTEIPSRVSGILTHILVAEGETVQVGARLAAIDVAGGADEGHSTFTEGDPPCGWGEDRSNSREFSSAVSSETEPARASTVRDLGSTPGEERDEIPARGPRVVGIEPIPERSGDPRMGTKLLSPAVLALLEAHGVDSEAIDGTGTGGRITPGDVLAASESKSGDPMQSVTPVEATDPKSPPLVSSGLVGAPVDAPRVASAVVPSGRDEVIPFSRIRAATAEHMVRSKNISAHALVVVDVDYYNVDAVRRAKKASLLAQDGINLTYLPFVSRAVVDAIRAFPQINASVGTDALLVHRYVNLGIAVDLDFEGLVVPVIKSADGKRLRAIAHEAADLATRARTRKLTFDDLLAGTFTITNAGGSGTLFSSPVINQPQLAILSMGGVKKRPVVLELPDGVEAVVIRPVGNLALSWDHRAVDGAYASAFLAKIREILETRDWDSEF